MKFGIALLAGLLVTQGVTTKLNINISGCKIHKANKKEAFGCSCEGGSGDYDWHFSDLPDGWQIDQDKIYPSSGKFIEKKIYGTRVQVFDRKSQDSVKKSLFFSFQNGKIRQVADHDFNFDVKQLLPGNKFNSPYTANVKKVFDSVDGIGSGCGLPKLVTYYTGNGFYKGDNDNPYLNRLPLDGDLDKIIEAGNFNEVRILFVNVARSRAPCKDIDAFLNRCLLKLRIKIGKFKDDVYDLKQLIATLQNQIQNLQLQLQYASAQDANTAALIAQLKQFKIEKAKAQQDRANYETILKQALNQADDLESNLSNLIQQNRRLKQKVQQRKQQIIYIDNQIAQLQNKINQLNANRNEIISNSRADEQALELSNRRIAQIQIQIRNIKENINDTRAKIRELFAFIEATTVKILDTQRQLQLSNYQQRSNNIRRKIEELQSKLNQARAKLGRVQPYYDDLSKNYDDFIRVQQTNYNVCYKNIFNDNQEEFQEDDDGEIYFAGQSFFDNYIQKVFGSGFRAEGNLKQGGGIQFINIQQNTKIRLRRANIFSPEWIRVHGNPGADNYGQSANQKFIQNDFDCNSFNQASAYKGRILSIAKNVAIILNEKNEKCQVYLGGCTRIESVNKQLPEIGDQIYWRGVQRDGKNNHYNAKHILCK